MFYVYIFQNTVNNKVYIGKTNDFVARYKKHLQISNRVKFKNSNYSLIHKAISKYGIDNFSFQILEEFENQQDAFDAEVFWIEFFRSNVNKFGNECGYNLTNGGDGTSGWKHIDSAKKQIAESLRQIKLGTHLTEDTKNKISNTLLNAYTRISWPTDNELVDMVKVLGLKNSAKKLGVTDNAVRGRLKKRSLLTKEVTDICKSIQYKRQYKNGT